MSLRLRAFPDHGVLVWFALLTGIAAWSAHLASFAVFVEVVQDRGWFWLFHVGNAAAVLLTLLALALSWAMFRAGDADEEAGTPGGRIRFLGALALLLNTVNLLLIVVEGSYVFVIPVHHG